MKIKTLTSIILVGTLALGNSGCEETTDHSSRPQQIEKTIMFPREKFLTISAKEYCESIEKKLSDYIIVGLFAEYDDIQKVIPHGTEVIVDYDFDCAGTQYEVHRYETGTTLVPKSYLPDSTEIGTTRLN